MGWRRIWLGATALVVGAGLYLLGSSPAPALANLAHDGQQSNAGPRTGGQPSIQTAGSEGPCSAVNAAPDKLTVTTDNATEVTSNSAHLLGTLVSLGTGISANVSFQWGTSSGRYTNETPPQQMAAPGPFYADLADLSGNVTYYFRAKAVGQGTDYGLQRTFVTLPVSEPSVTTENASSVTMDSARLNGTLASTGSAGSANVSFEWGTSSGNYTAETPSQRLSTPGPFFADLTILSADTAYYFRAKAVGQGTAYGKEKSFTTLSPPDTTPPAPVTDLTTSNGTSTAITLTWTAPGDDNVTGTASQYDVRYATAPINDTNWDSATQASGEPTPLDAGSPQTFVVTGLSANTTYYFALKTADEVPNWSALSNVPSGTTPPAPDTTPPAVTIDQTAGQADPTNGSPINFTVVFSEPVSDFATGDVTLSGTAGATTATVSGSGTTYDVAVSGMATDGTVVVSIPAGVASDAAGNANTASTSTHNTVTYDSTPPGVTITQAAGQADPTNGSPINFTVVFSEPVADFATGDVTLTGTAGATTATVSGSGTTYSVAVSGMTSDGTVTASVAAGAAHDDAGNANAASTTIDDTVTRDTAAPGKPTGLSLAADDDTGISDTDGLTKKTSGLTVSGGAEPNSTVELLDGASSLGATIASEAGSWSMDIDLTQGVHSIVAKATDAAGNASVASDALTITVDTTSPTVTVNQADGQADPTNGSPINFTVVFSEPVADFATGDVTLTGTADATTATASGSGTAYKVAVIGMASDGTVIVSIVAGVASDAAGNANTASTSTDNTVTYDATPPAAVNDLATSDVTSTSMTLTWTAPGDDNAVGTASQYDIRYATMPIDSGNWDSVTQASGEPTPLGAGSPQTLVVTGLSTNTTYYFALRTADEVFNWSGLSNSASATTLTPTPLSVQTDDAGNITTSSARLNGSLVSTGGATSVTVSFEWGTASGDYTAETPGQEMGGPGQFSADLSSLSSGAVYYFRAKAVGSETVYGAEKSFKTAVSGSGGLGGGGGGGGGGPAGPGVTNLTIFTNDEGVFNIPATASSEDAGAQVSIAKGVQARTKDGGPLKSMSITKAAEPAPPPSGAALVGPAYDFGPEGATFSPSIALSLKYDRSSLPSGLTEKNLVAATWDAAAGEWVEIRSAVDADGAKITVTVSHFSRYAVLVHSRPANFSLSDLAISSTQTLVGETVTVTVTVNNQGDLAGTCQVALNVNGAVVDTTNVSVAGQASSTATFTMKPDAPGSYAIAVGGLSATLVVSSPPAPAAFVTKSLDLSSGQANVGDSVLATAIVANTGDVSGTFTVALTVDGKVRDSRSVTLAGGSTEKVVFTVREDAPGTYILGVGGRSGTLVVAALPTKRGGEPNWWLIGGMVAVFVALVTATVLTFNHRRAARGLV